MSLINQMLKDLEKRARHNSAPEICLSGILSDESKLLQANNRTPIFILLSILLGLFLVCFYKNIFYMHQSLIHSSTKNPTIAAKVNANENTKPDILPLSPETPSVLTGITIQAIQNTTNIEFLLNKQTFYS